MAELLLSRGACANARARGGLTPLHTSSMKGNVEIGTLLLRHGARAEELNEVRVLVGGGCAVRARRQRAVRMATTAFKPLRRPAAASLSSYWSGLGRFLPPA